MIAFIVDGEDNESYAFREAAQLTEHQQLHQELVPDMTGETRPGLRRCNACRELLFKWEEPLFGLTLDKRRFDLSATYDGVDIGSLKFKAVYDAAALSGLEFRHLPDDPEFFMVRANRIVEFDPQRSKTRFVKPCPKCGRFESVVGATPAFLKPGNIVGSHEFVRTDLEFGSGDEKHPLLICGPAAVTALSKAKLKGLELTQVEEGV